MANIIILAVYVDYEKAYDKVWHTKYFTPISVCRKAAV
jgi:hypothetical protein